ncbi:MAG TPA: branched-chain amino acid ABC transporter permease [Alphaproteobacteria bacterium]|nr:branched-chain amino acid ABC transporter permease [Alphaproteobacteria bacterium]
MKLLPAGLGLAFLLAAMAAVPQFADEYIVGVALSLAMWIALTESWVLLSGLTGYVSLGHVVFYGIGSYVGVLVWQQVPMWQMIALAGLSSGLFALVVGYPVLRVRGPYFVMLTFGIAELVKFVVIDIEAQLGEFSRLVLGGPSVTDLYYVMLGMAAAAVVLTYAVGRSRAGYALRAIRENEEAAETVGVPVARYKLAVFALSAVIPGMVGAVMAVRSSYFEPSQAFDPVISFTIVTMAIIGGSDNARGPLVGSAFLVILSELLWDRAPQMYMILLGLLLIAFVLFAPGGVTAWRLPRFGGARR